MTEDREPPSPRGDETRAAARLGFWLAIAVSVLTVVSFGLAMTALPDRVPYPFTDPVIAEQWPGEVTVLQPSLEKGQLDGWAMLTMYNPDGVRRSAAAGVPISRQQKSAGARPG